MKQPFQIGSLIKCGKPVLLLAAAQFLPHNGYSAEKMPMNVLFIVVDDLKPMLGCYGNTKIHTPNIDRLASWGTVFMNTYCQQAVSAPTRVSLLTGFRPDFTKVHDLNTPLVSVRPDLVTLPALMLKNGYSAVSLGKVFHHGKNDSPSSWSTDPWTPKAGQWVSPANLILEKKFSESPGDRRPYAFERYNAPDNFYRDGQVAEKAVEYLKEFKKSEKPFFLATGFIKPHLPFNCPEKYWKIYDNMAIGLPENNVKPAGSPDISMTSWGEIRKYKGIPQKGPIPPDTSRILIQGYMACVSFTDAQIGKLLDEIENLGMKDNTMIVLWGDHGWHLGDHGLWCKHTNFEQATHAPLIVYVPGYEGGKKATGMTEFVDVYPTITEACAIDPPPGLQGISLLPVLKDSSIKLKKYACSQYPRGKVMGYTLRDERFRYTAWVGPQGNVIATEMFDYEVDPDETENFSGRSNYVKEEAILKRAVLEYASSYIK